MGLGLKTNEAQVLTSSVHGRRDSRWRKREVGEWVGHFTGSRFKIKTGLVWALGKWGTREDLGEEEDTRGRKSEELSWENYSVLYSKWKARGLGIVEAVSARI
ncbi:hypothetical protein U1Q18_036194 [Sarracenia purpurea var. burkii]